MKINPGGAARVTSSGIEKRAYKRKSAKIGIRLAIGNMFYSGLIVNFSEYGIFIRSKLCILPESMFMVIIPHDNKMLTVIARLKWVTKKGDYCDGMGVEIINPAMEYIEFTKSFGS